MPDPLPELTPEEAEEVARMRANLHANGYRDIPEHGSITVGARIRHRGQQWPDALQHGAGYVVALTEKPDSAWSVSWGMADIELIAVWDKPWGLASSRLAQIAQYHVAVIDSAVTR